MIFNLLSIILKETWFEFKVLSFENEDTDWIHSLFFIHIEAERIVFDVCYLSLFFRYILK